MVKSKFTIFCLLILFCSSYVQADSDPPAAVSDLSCDYVGCVEGQVRLTWTAPMEDGSYGGQVQNYIIKYSEYSVDYWGDAAVWWAAPVTYEISHSLTPSNPGEIDTLTITQHPSDVTALAGEQVQLTAAATTTSGNAITYEWLRDGKSLIDAFENIPCCALGDTYFEMLGGEEDKDG